MKDEKLIIRQAELLQQELETLVGKYPFGQDDVMSRLQVIANRAREHADRSFVILVAGPVKSGKSTFVNLVSNAFVSPTHFLECTVRPSIISAAEGDEEHTITVYKSENSARVVEQVDAIVDHLRGLIPQDAIPQVSRQDWPLSPANIDEHVALDMSDINSDGTLMTTIKTPGGKLLTGEKSKVRLPAILLLLIGIALPVAAVIVMVGTDEALRQVMTLPAIGACFAGGLLCLFLAGLFFKKKNNAVYSEKQLKAENRIDANKIYQALHSILLIVDRNLGEALSAQRLEERQRAEANEQPQDNAALTLYGDLLEAARAGDGEYALDQLGKVTFYLHQQGIETLEYSTENRTWFDVIPGERKETIRPALVKDGKLLKKGIVSGDW
mgnify:CR=1 FL=1